MQLKQLWTVSQPTTPLPRRPRKRQCPRLPLPPPNRLVPSAVARSRSRNQCRARRRKPNLPIDTAIPAETGSAPGRERVGQSGVASGGGGSIKKTREKKIQK